MHRPVTWPNTRPAPAVLPQLVDWSCGLLGGRTGVGAGLGRGPMGARAGRRGRSRALGAGPGGGGANERAPRPGPAGARDAAERLVANVTVCKRRGVVKGAGRGALTAAWVRPLRVCPKTEATGGGGRDGETTGSRVLGEAACSLWGRVGSGSEGRTDAGALGPAAPTLGLPYALGIGRHPFPGAGAAAWVR
jgi:hypothetical protein